MGRLVRKPKVLEAEPQSSDFGGMFVFACEAGGPRMPPATII